MTKNLNKKTSKKWEFILRVTALLLIIPASRLEGTILGLVLWEVMMVIGTMGFFRQYIYDGLVYRKVQYNLYAPIALTGIWAVLYSIGTILFLIAGFLAPSTSNELPRRKRTGYPAEIILNGKPMVSQNLPCKVTSQQADVELKD